MTIKVTAVKGEETLHFDSLTEAAKALGVTTPCISISLKKQWKVKGYILTKA